MSGIAGIFYRNNKPVTIKQLEAMGATLAHRGPDGINYYSKDFIGLVHCMFHDTPESLLETLPNRTEDDTVVLTFHGRIDNRQTLYDKIGWIKPLTVVTDSDLVLAAYQKWRNDCVNYLLGDFAFVIWNETEKKVFCVRDHMGVKPFYYWISEDLFVFASEIKALLTMPEISRVLNDERIADYLTSIVLDTQSTFYKNILRLPPGHCMEIRSERSLVLRYHQFSPITLNCKTDGEYEEQFREIFFDAVRVRLRSYFPVGSFLSGGLDSTSIVCASALLFENETPDILQTFSGVFDTVSKCDERKYFLSVLERYRVKPHSLTIDLINPANSYEKIIKYEDEPFCGPHVFMYMELLSLAKKAGVRVLLDGHDGDASVSYGYSFLTELALSGKLLKLVDCYKQAGFHSPKALVKRIIRLYWNVICNKIPVSLPFSPVRRDIEKSLTKINGDFASNTGVKSRLLNSAQMLPFIGQKEVCYHFKNITQPFHPFVLEFFERIAIREGMIIRYPYFDRRVIEFCLALPVEQKFQNSLNRSIVRRALANILPESVRERRGKTNFNASLLHAFLENDQGWLMENIATIANENYNCINKERLLSSIAAFNKTENPDKASSLRDLLLAVSLSRWKIKNLLNQ